MGQSSFIGDNFTSQVLQLQTLGFTLGLTPNQCPSLFVLWLLGLWPGSAWRLLLQPPQALYPNKGHPRPFAQTHLPLVGLGLWLSWSCFFLSLRLSESTQTLFSASPGGCWFLQPLFLAMPLFPRALELVKFLRAKALPYGSEFDFLKQSDGFLAHFPPVPSSDYLCLVSIRSVVSIPAPFLWDSETG